MKAMDHLKMPELIKTRYPVKLSTDEREAYNKLKEDLVLEMHPASLGLFPVTDESSTLTATNAAALANKLLTASWMPWRISSKPPRHLFWSATGSSTTSSGSPIA